MFKKGDFAVLTVNLNEKNFTRRKKRSYKHLLRFSRETKTQLISDVQRIELDISAEDIQYKHNQWESKRFTKEGESLRFQSGADYPNENTIASFTQESVLCPVSYADLFQTPVSQMNVGGLLRYMDVADDATMEKFVKPASDTEWDAEIVKHLQDLFGLPVHTLCLLSERDANTDSDDLALCAVEYQINHFGKDRKIISFEDDYHNRKVLLWVFADRVVFTYTR